jgi:hypothetical protein
VLDDGSVDTPEGQELDFELLAKLLVATTTPPTLLLLDARETLGGADLLLPAVPVIVAMSDTIADVAASVFVSQFYAAIASAQTVGVALAQAKVAMEIAQLDDAELPEAVARDDVDIDDLVLLAAPVRNHRRRAAPRVRGELPRLSASSYAGRPERRATSRTTAPAN